MASEKSVDVFPPVQVSGHSYEDDDLPLVFFLNENWNVQEAQFRNQDNIPHFFFSGRIATIFQIYFFFPSKIVTNTALVMGPGLSTNRFCKLKNVAKWLWWCLGSASSYEPDPIVLSLFSIPLSTSNCLRNCGWIAIWFLRKKYQEDIWRGGESDGRKENTNSPVAMVKVKHWKPCATHPIRSSGFWILIPMLWFYGCKRASPKRHETTAATKLCFAEERLCVLQTPRPTPTARVPPDTLKSRP